MVRNSLYPSRIPCLDGLRAMSILLVLLGHSLNTAPFSGFWFQLSAPIMTNAAAGVTIFFVISGYLITSLLQVEWQRTRTIDLCGFYQRRVLRIFPAFYSFVFVILLLTCTRILTVAPNQFFSAATFLWNYRHLWNVHVDDGTWFLGHFWTLSLEEQFYLLWPLMLLMCSPSRAVYVAMALIVLSPPLRVASYFLWPDARGEIQLMLHTASDPLMFGCLAALAQGSSWFEKGWDRIERWGCLAPVVAMTFLLLVAPYLSQRFRGSYSITVGMTLEAACITIILLWLVRHPQSLIGRGLQHPVLVHLGTLSYSLYIWQQLFLTTSNTTWSGRFPLNLLVVLGVAEVSYHFLERPFLRLRRRHDPPLPNASLP